MLVVLIEVTFLTASFVNVIDSSQEKFSPWSYFFKSHLRKMFLQPLQWIGR
jgi:hypothetical protein